MNQNQIRNFAIIAHIDHGKSTLADRIMEQTQTVSARASQAQLLDDMQVEQAHGVTVKSRTVRNFYQADDGVEYEYNLIDTPGHVDFSYEVSKSLAASDGAILLVDATQAYRPKPWPISVWLGKIISPSYLSSTKLIVPQLTSKKPSKRSARWAQNLRKLEFSTFQPKQALAFTKSSKRSTRSFLHQGAVPMHT